ncbi:MAG: serine hydrolase [Patescibacteria group bacterium]
MKQNSFYYFLGLGFLIVFFLAGILYFSFRNFSSQEAVSPAVSSELEDYPKTTYLPVKFSPAPGEVLARPDLKAKAGLLFDLNASQSVFEKNSEEKLPIASLTKLMTALVVLENFSGQRDDRFFILDDDLKIENSYTDLKPGDNFSFDELLHLMLIRSDNVAAFVLAKTVAGDESSFVLRMNQKARFLGMENTLFYDSAGLENNISTASDLRILAKEILSSYPEIFSISKINELTIVSPNKKTFEIKNTNVLIGKIPGLVGSKTGFTPEALGSLLVVFDYNQKTLVSVVLGSEDRFGDSSALISWYWQLKSDNIN